MPSRPISNPDERQATPASIASQLGWARGRQFGWSWDRLLDLAEQRYWINRNRRAA